MKKSTETVLGIILAIWFLITIAGIFYASKSEELKWLIPVLFGQLMFTGGLFAAVFMVVRKEKAVWITGIFIAVGAAVLAYGLSDHFGGNETKMTLSKLMPAALFVVLMAVGLCGFIAAITSKRRLEKRYPTEIEATCVDHRVYYRKGQAMKSPVYRIVLDGEEYTIAQDQYSGGILHGVPEIGEMRTLYIDKDNLSRFSDPIQDRPLKVFLCIFSAMLFFMGAAALYFVTFGHATQVY